MINNEYTYVSILIISDREERVAATPAHVVPIRYLLGSSLDLMFFSEIAEREAKYDRFILNLPPRR